MENREGKSSGETGAAKVVPVSPFYFLYMTAQSSEDTGTVRMTPQLEAIPCMISIAMSYMLTICWY